MHPYLISLGRINLNRHPQIDVKEIGVELETCTNGFFFIPFLYYQTQKKPYFLINLQVFSFDVSDPCNDPLLSGEVRRDFIFIGQK